MTEWGDPGDVAGECNAHCYIGDNYGDGTANDALQAREGARGPSPRRVPCRDVRPHLEERRTLLPREGLFEGRAHRTRALQRLFTHLDSCSGIGSPMKKRKVRK